MSLDFTLLKEEQIWGDNALDVMKKYGTRVAPTDLGVLLGGYMTGGDYRTSEGDLTCTSWSTSPYGDGMVCCIDFDGYEGGRRPDRRWSLIRPALPPSEVAKISLKEIKSEVFGCQVVEYGEYPQTAVDEHTSKRLESLRQSGSLRPTGKDYTFDSVDLESWYTPFRATSCPEYELDGKKYIHVLGRPADDDSRLSNGERVEKGKSYWVQVQPIEWLMDPSGTMIAKKCLCAGIQFDARDEYYYDFSRTFVKRYLDNYFAKEIEPSERQEEREKRLKREETIKGLKAKLTEAIDPEKVEAKVGFTRTESRREIAKAIKTTRRARDVFIAAGKKAQKEGDQELINQIVEMADFYVRSDQAQRSAARQRRAASRAQRAAAKKDSER